ncbi:hypothetical protein [Rubrivirga sp. IMCC43871]|uniref:hypothetical protein n=1 Tax=Rubrivirga sp. IMCC43871 TaxID=3391575 RepID=UPI00398FAD22
MRWGLLIGVAISLVVGIPPPDGGGLADRIADRVQQGDGAVVDLAALAPFEWDRLYIVGPYVSQGVFEAQTGVDWPFWWRWGWIDWLDDRVLLVFADEDEAVAAVELERQDGMMTPTVDGARQRSLRPQDARFIVEFREGAFFPGLTPAH